MSTRLSPERLSILEPLLGALARIISNGRPLTEEMLRTLLKGVELESDHAARKELERWGDLLSRVRSAPSSANRLATAEALGLRGLHYAPVLLAVNLVSPCEALETSAKVVHFGRVKAGTRQTLQFDVWGAAGAVFFTSSFIHVTPHRFGPERTTLQVELRAAPCSTIYACVELLSVDGKMIIPVIAECEGEAAIATLPPVRPSVPQSIPTAPQVAEDPTKTPSATLSAAGKAQSALIAPSALSPQGPQVVTTPDVAVTIEGIGQFATIEEAIEKAPPEATLKLNQGTYVLQQPLMITKPLRIEGNHSSLLCRAAGSVITFSGSHEWRLSQLTLSHEGPEGGNALELVSGRLVLQGCSIQAGAGSSPSIGGNGLVAKGQSRLEASLCFFTHCQRYGLLLSDSAEVILNTCTIDHNQTGLFAGDSSHPKLSSCFCLSNRTDGLLFAGKSVGRVNGGTYEANGQAGIVLAENSRGVVNRAICRKNLHGIEARDSTHLKLKNNTCEENRECGILIGDSSEAGLIGNICTGNVFGIRFTGYKEQKLEGNRCSLNTGSDIAYEDAARPNLKSR